MNALRVLLASDKNPLFKFYVEFDETAFDSLAYNSNHTAYVRPMLIEKLIQFSSYALKFYQIDKVESH